MQCVICFVFVDECSEILFCSFWRLGIVGQGEGLCCIGEVLEVCVWSCGILVDECLVVVDDEVLGCEIVVIDDIVGWGGYCCFLYGIDWGDVVSVYIVDFMDY